MKISNIKISAKPVHQDGNKFWKGYWVLKNDAGDYIKETIDITRKSEYDAISDAVKDAQVFAEQNNTILITERI